MSLLYVSDAYLLGITLWLLAGTVALWLLVWLRRKWKSHSGRRRWTHVAFSMWVVLAVLTGVELYYAFMYDTTDSFNMTNVSVKWLKMHADRQKRPLHTDGRRGFLYRDDHDFPKSVGPQRHRICFFGDSFTFGHGIANISDRFSNRVGEAFERRSPGKFSVTNLADPGRDLNWIHLQLQELFKAGYAIDTVIYVVCLNDIETFDPRHRTYYDNFRGRVGGPEFFLFRDTYFFNLMYFRLKQFTVPEVRNYYSFVKEYYEGPPWQRMRRKLDRVHELCRINEADFRIVIFPFLHNLSSHYPFQEAHKLIADYGRESNIPVLDLQSVLAAHAAEGLTVNRFDAHPNELAHQLAAEAIQKKLLSDLFKSAIVSKMNPSESKE